MCCVVSTICYVSCLLSSICCTVCCGVCCIAYCVYQGIRAIPCTPAVSWLRGNPRYARWAGAPGAWLARARRPLPPLAPLTRRKVVPSLAYARRDPATHSGGIPYIWGGGIYGGIYEGSWRGSSWAIECIVNARARAKWGGREGPNRGTLAYSTI